MGGTKAIPIAFVLINTEIGAEYDIVDAIKEIEGVQEAFTLWGVYDVIAKITADTNEKLHNIINENFHMDKILSKLTIIIKENTRTTRPRKIEPERNLVVPLV